MGKWGLPSPRDEEGMEKVTQVPKLQPPIRWKGWEGKSVQGTLKAIAF